MISLLIITCVNCTRSHGSKKVEKWSNNLLIPGFVTNIFKYIKDIRLRQRLSFQGWPFIFCFFQSLAHLWETTTLRSTSNTSVNNKKDKHSDSSKTVRGMRNCCSLRCSCWIENNKSPYWIHLFSFKILK